MIVPPQKEAKLLWDIFSELKERAKKQMLEEMKKEMKKIEDDWFKTFMIDITHKKP